MEKPKNPREISFEDRLLLLISRMDLSIQSINSAINPPFPKEEIVNPSDELRKQYEEREKEERQVKPIRDQNKILFITLIITFITSTITGYLQYEQTKIANSEILPQIKLMSVQLQNEKQIYSDNQIRVYNYGRAISNLKIDSFVLVKPDNSTLATKNKELILKGYYFYTVLNNSEDNLEMLINGVKDNNTIIHNLSNELYISKGTFLSLDIYFKVNYFDLNNKEHTDYYQLNGFEAKRIANQEGVKTEEKNKNIPSVDLEKTSSKELINLFGFK
ncbi:MAG: hypothetical protein Q7R95_07005 [bacterium]|nr:hypothetical protein [bacterium]